MSRSRGIRTFITSRHGTGSSRTPSTENLKLGEGGEEGPCGWLHDKYGLSWQVVPKGMDEVFSHADPKRAERAMGAMLQMKKLDVAALREAADGVTAS